MAVNYSNYTVLFTNNQSSYTTTLTQPLNYKRGYTNTQSCLKIAKILTQLWYITNLKIAQRANSVKSGTSTGKLTLISTRSTHNNTYTHDILV